MFAVIERMMNTGVLAESDVQMIRVRKKAGGGLVPDAR